jgi:hypothetical protein
VPFRCRHLFFCLLLALASDGVGLIEASRRPGFEVKPTRPAFFCVRDEPIHPLFCTIESTIKNTIAMEVAIA